MLHAQHRNFKRERLLEFWLSSLIAASVLVFAIAPGSVSANVNRAERLNHRISVPSRGGCQRHRNEASHCRLLPM